MISSPPPPQFGAVKLVIQSQAYRAVDEFRQRAAEARARISQTQPGYGLISGHSNDPLEVAVQAEVGDSPDPQGTLKTIKEKFDTFAKQQVQEANDDRAAYHALFLDLGTVPHPLLPDRTTPQKLLIDGPDVTRFSNAMWQKMANPTLGGTIVSDDALTPLRSPENALQAVQREWTAKLMTEIKAGNTQNLIDLDAPPTGLL